MKNDNASKVKRCLVVGSLAFDYLMHYEGVFQEKILPENLHALSISFGVSGRKTAFGGCGGNIAFHLKKSGASPLLYGLAGNDFSPYHTWLKKHGIDTSFLSYKELPTPAAYVVSDRQGHQIAIFDEGAAKDFTFDDLVKLRNTVVAHRDEIVASIIAPTNIELMKTACLMSKELRIPYFFDPGQAIIKFSRADLRNFVEHAEGVFVNEYEMTLLLKETGYSRSELENICPLVVETLGENGSLITYRGERIAIEAIKPSVIRDPTGCGDAYRAGFLSSLLKDEVLLTKELDAYASMEKAGFEGSRLGSYVLSIEGTQG